MANILPVGTAADTASSSIVLTAGQSANVNIISGANGADANTVRQFDALVLAEIQYQGSDAGWYPFASLNSKNPLVLISGAGTFRVVRKAGNIGVDSN